MKFKVQWIDDLRNAWKFATVWWYAFLFCLPDIWNLVVQADWFVTWLGSTPVGQKFSVLIKAVATIGGILRIVKFQAELMQKQLPSDSQPPSS
jgi:hypothetical protein